MRTSPYAIKLIGAISFWATSALVGVHATVLDVSSADVVGGITVWRGVVNSAGTGYLIDGGGPSTGPDPSNPGLLDNQTGQKVADLVGTSTAPTLYIGYGTVGGVDYIGFRMRLNQFDSLSGLKQSNYVGFDFGATATNPNVGVADLFVGADVVDQNSSKWRIVIIDTTGTNATDNTSPSTTTLAYGNNVTPLNSYTTNSSNLNYQEVTAANSTVGGITQFPDASNTYPTPAPDAFLTFALPFADFVAAIQNVNVMGSGFTFDANTTFQVTAATGNQSNNINQDALLDPSQPFNFSTTMNTSGTIGSTINPVPEPAMVFSLGALITPGLFMLGRRRHRSR